MTITFPSSYIVGLVEKKNKQPNYYYNFFFYDSDFVSETWITIPSIQCPKCASVHDSASTAGNFLGKFSGAVFHVCSYLHGDLFGEYATLWHTRWQSSGEKKKIYLNSKYAPSLLLRANEMFWQELERMTSDCRNELKKRMEEVRGLKGDHMLWE